MLFKNIFYSLALVASLCSGACAQASSLKWSNYRWTVRNDAGGPGPNTFTPSNVSVDSNGYLHLKITKVGTQWTCSEITLNETLGLGTYQFFVTGPIDKLDKNIVLGLFNYPAANVGPDGTHEIDIECARWGDAKNPNGNFTVYPKRINHDQVTYGYEFALPTLDSTQRFNWSPQAVSFQSLTGHTDGDDGQFAAWTTPKSFAPLVGHARTPVHLNLWLFQGMAPSDGQPVEIIVQSFKYTAPGK